MSLRFGFRGTAFISIVEAGGFGGGSFGLDSGNFIG